MPEWSLKILIQLKFLETLKNKIMNEENNNPFADFEQFIDEESSTFKQVFNAQPVSGVTLEGLAEGELGVALQITLEALNGNFHTVLGMSDSEKKYLTSQILNAFNTLMGNSPDGDMPVLTVKSSQELSPSDKKAAKVVQTPEEAAREKEFRDFLGI